MEAFTLGLWIFGILLSFGLLIGIIRRNKRYRDLSEQVVGWTIYGFILAVILMITITKIDREYQGESWDHYLYIYSLKNKSDIDGDFALGFGTIETVEYYYFYYKSEYGYERDKLPTNEVSIIESTKRPEIKEVFSTYKGKHLKWGKQSKDKYIMYVPRGTVIKRFFVY